MSKPQTLWFLFVELLNDWKGGGSVLALCFPLKLTGTANTSGQLSLTHKLTPLWWLQPQTVRGTLEWAITDYLKHQMIYIVLWTSLIYSKDQFPSLLSRVPLIMEHLMRLGLAYMRKTRMGSGSFYIKSYSTCTTHIFCWPFFLEGLGRNRRS